MDKPGKIFQQIPKIMKEMDAIGKDSKNQQQGYKFRSIDAVYNELHSRFAEHGIFSAPEVLSFERVEKPTKAGGVMQYTLARIKYTFFADDGSSVSLTVLGEGSDSGDKSANKSMAVAHKYALVQAFLIPTNDDSDPDFQSHEVARREPIRTPVAPPQQAARPQPTPPAQHGQNIGDFLVPFGRNKGTRIALVGKEQLLDDVGYWETRAQTEGKPLGATAAAYVNAIKTYLASLTHAVAQGPGPGAYDAPLPPAMTNEDDIPF